MSSSPVTTHFPPPSPSRDSPNAHPYAIKTSSSAVLTRSNSVGHRQSTNHHYTPMSPSKSPLAAKQSRYVPSHRHTRSMSSVNEDPSATPPPVPLPPSSSVLVGFANKGLGEANAASDGEIPPTPPMTWRIKRSDTLPSIFPNKSDSEVHGQEDLPKNPKLWTPSQLSVYLSSALRLKGDVKLPVPVRRDIAAFVVQEHLSGRAFLRMKKEDYDNLGINQLWKDTLLDASRALRQNIVQGRIMGFGSGSLLSPEMHEQDEYFPSADLPDLPKYGALNSNHRRVPLQWEEDKKRMGKTTFRAGRVRGMVETYERSCSESSASGSDCEDDEDKIAPVGDILSQEVVSEPEGHDAGFASGELNSGTEDEARGLIKNGAAQADLGPSMSSPAGQDVTAKAAVDDSPSIEALLREQEQSGVQGRQYQSWGAKAWEDEVKNPQDVHVTAKRVPPEAQAVLQRMPPAEWQNTMPHPGAVTVRTGLASIFEQPVHEAPPVPKAIQDARVEDELVHGEPGPTLYETLETFQKRLEIVEKRLDELERQNMARDDTHDREQREPIPDSHMAVIKQHLPRAFDVLYPADRKERHVKNYTEMDPSISGLPRYMFFISLGVVAVVTRVVFQRIVGGKKRK